MPRAIALYLYEDFQLLDACGPITSFEIAGRMAGDAYRLILFSAKGGAIRSSSGVALETLAVDRAHTIDTLIVAQARIARCRSASRRRSGGRSGRDLSLQPRHPQQCRGPLRLTGQGNVCEGAATSKRLRLAHAAVFREDVRRSNPDRPNHPYINVIFHWYRSDIKGRERTRVGTSW